MESDGQSPQADRRPLKSRSSWWAGYLARLLIRMRISPNAISIASIFVAALGAFLLVHTPTAGGLLGAAVCIQLRLLCNMLDGMVAIEGGRQSSSGALFNEIPDRIADSLLIVALGFSIGMPWIGWYGALSAAITAYIRVLGGSLGLPQSFRGPMAKPHRMATITVGCLLGAIEWRIAGSHWALSAAAWVVAIGATVTCASRTMSIAHQLRSR